MLDYSQPTILDVGRERAIVAPDAHGGVRDWNLAVFVQKNDIIPLNDILLQLLDHRAGGVDVR